MGDRNKILTINAGSKNFQKSYMTRSRGKLVVEEDSSSNDDIREMLRDIEKGENDPSEAKLKTCPK